ncbi:MAG: RES family NAD+ phosphorylase [Methylococcales bacterium]
MSIWQQCNGNRYKTAIQTSVVRVVESQEQVATMMLVDNSTEQAILEDLLEATKPQPPAQSAAYHYLIKTPFRYPPLRHGSRFGSAAQPGIFYASLQLKTALAECAYYRLYFLSGMQELPEKHLVTEHTTFKVNIDTDAGIALEQKPFKQFTNAISNPVNYAISQQLGSDLRDSGVAVFTYQSARDRLYGLNAGIFTITSIKSRKPHALQEWLCSTAATNVTFVSKLNKETRYSFELEEFLLHGKLPQPSI